MGKGLKRKRDRKGEEPPSEPTHLRPTQIVLRRLRQACYGICGGAFVVIPAAMVGEHVPTLRMLLAMGSIALFSGVTGLLIEIVENRVFPGDGDDN